MSNKNELDYLLDSMPNRTGITRNIDRHMAQLILDRVEGNRKTKPHNVNNITNEMNSDEWENTGDPIKFGTKNETVDGYHRLTSFLNSKLDTIEVTLFKGVTQKGVEKIDQGIRRTLSDTVDIKFRGKLKNTSVVTGGMKLVMALNMGRYGDAGATSRILNPTEITRLLVSDQAKWENLGSEAKRYYKDSGGLINPSLMYALRYHTSQISQKDSDTFFDSLSRIVHCGDDSPITALKKKLGKHKGNRLEVKLTQSEVVNLFIVAWNKFREGKKCKVLHVPESDTPLVMI